MVLLSWLALSPVRGAAQTSSHIQALVEAGALNDMSRPNFGPYQSILEEFYSSRVYAPAWFQGTSLTPEAIAMIEILQKARDKGLDPEDYDASRWKGRRQELENPGADVDAVDVALSVNAMRYVSDLRIGRVNPKHLSFDLPTEAKRYDLAEFVRERLLTASDLSVVMDSIEPPFAGYRHSQQALIRYQELARTDDGEKLPASDKPIESGESYAGMARLTKLLRLVGDLPQDLPETTPEVYAGPVVDGVKRFQRRHGLQDDGRLGPATLHQLNIPLAERVHQLELSLERWRWLPEEFHSPPVVVNVPDFHLRALDAENHVAIEMRVVAGKAMTTQTPVFSRDMTYVVFRPYWNVPPGIMRRQILPGIRRDRDYIAAHGYEVTSHDGTLITSGEISDEVLAQLQSGRLTVRQKPGPKNALGLVKLMFPNEHHVYLHSTPTTAHFSQARRDFSSGCIRLERPAELAAWVLRSNPGWTLERVREAMESGGDNVTVRLAQRVPVFILYTTAIAYENDEVHFYPDLYGHDARLSAAIAELHSSSRSSAKAESGSPRDRLYLDKFRSASAFP